MSTNVVDQLIKVIRGTHVHVRANRRRNHRITIRYFGLDARGGASMDEVGAEFGVTRESVRQITGRIIRQIQDRKDLMERAVHCLQCAVDLAPDSLAAIEARLAEDGLLPPNVPLTGVMRATAMIWGSEVVRRLGGVEPVLEVSSGECFLLRSDQSSVIRDIQSAVTRMCTRDGLASLADLTPLVGGQHREPEAFLRRLLAARADALWLKGHPGYVTLVGKSRNILESRLLRVFSVVGEIELSHMRDALVRSWPRGPDGTRSGSPLGDDLLVDYLQSRFDAVVEGECVRVARAPVAIDDALSGVELRVVRQLLTAPSYTMRERDIERAVLGDALPPEKGKFHLAIVYEYSPLVRKISRGQYRLVGTPRDAAG